MNHRTRILLVDDDPAVGTVLGALLRQAGHDVVMTCSAEAGLEAIAQGAIDLAICDLRMPGIDGLGFLARASKRWPGLPVVMLTAHGSIDRAVAAMKAGAAEFMLKPFDRDEILFVVDKILRSEQTRQAPPQPPPGDDTFVGESPAMVEVDALIDRAARSDATVLVRGETGTGKELVARAVHRRSNRSDGPFIKVHCAALPQTLLESELFGYEKGAFTGAAKQKPGRVELAHGGTLFLDEIGDVDPVIQVKLLRLLQDRAYERVGGTETLRADVRFVAATHRDLEAMIASEAFREDLFYRLNVVPIWTPPLRERPGDVRRLASHFCARFAASNARQVSLGPSALDRLEAEAWPGNVRELQNVVERLVVLSDVGVLGADDVERELGRSPSRSHGRSAERDAVAPSETTTLEMRRRRAERDAVVDALERCGGNRSQAARILGVSRRTLYNKLDEFDLA